MQNIDNIMNDIKLEIELTLEGKLMPEGVPEAYIEDMVGKVRALVVPAFDEQEKVISKRDMEIMQYEGKVEEMQDEIDRYEGEEADRLEEQERQEVIRLFNICSGGKVVYI